MGPTSESAVSSIDIRGKWKPDVSVVVPISERHDDIRSLYQAYADQLSKLGKTFEFIFILDGEFPVAMKDVSELMKNNHRIRMVKFKKQFGESSALMEGFRQARADTILTLASYMQIEPEGLKDMFDAFNEGNDLVITRRHPRGDPILNKLQSHVYHFFVRLLTGTPYKDITCGARLINRDVVGDFTLYGELHRFIPVFALKRGLRIKEVSIPQRREDMRLRFVNPVMYLRRALDILTLFFLVKFITRPLRFFGLAGGLLFLPGAVITTFLTVSRIFAVTALSNRPLFILGILLMVFGIQICSVGFVAELILFNHANEITEYRVEEIIE